MIEKSKEATKLFVGWCKDNNIQIDTPLSPKEVKEYIEYRNSKLGCQNSKNNKSRF